MAVAQKTYTTQLTEQLVNAAVTNRQLSRVFIKKLIPVTLSSIIYQRVNLSDDEADFTTYSFAGIPYKAFKRKLNNLNLGGIQNSMNGIQDAFEKECLKEVYLIFVDKETNQEVEVYRLNFKYLEANEADILQNGPKLKAKLWDRTKNLFKAIDMLKHKKNFNRQQVFLKIALTYFEEKTPNNYHPGNFSVIDVDTEKAVLELIDNYQQKQNEIMYLSILKTGHHAFECSTTTTEIQELSFNEDDITDLNETTTTNSNTSGGVSLLESGEATNENTNKKMIFKCLCNIANAIPHIDAVNCGKCHTFQHCVCIGFLSGNDVTNKYVCFECKGEMITPSNRKIKEEWNSACLTMALIHITKSFPNEFLHSLSAEKQKYILKRLATLKLVRKRDDDGYDVNTSRIKAAMLEYLPSARKRKPLPGSMDLFTGMDVIPEGTTKKPKIK